MPEGTTSDLSKANGYVGFAAILAATASLLAAARYADLLPGRFQQGQWISVEATLATGGRAVEVQPGRYQLVQLGTARRDQYVLDSATGRLWALVCMGKVDGMDCSGPLGLQELASPAASK